MSGSLKSTLQSLLKRVGVYHRLKASCLYDFYWSLADPQFVERTKKELQFYQHTLLGFTKGDIIFDIGANQGFKTAQFLKLGARVVAVEPDATNQAILKESFHALRLFKKSVTIVAKAVSDKTGQETMWVDEPGSAKNTLNPKWVETLRQDSSRFGESLQFGEKKTVETTTMEDLFKAHGRPFFIKIDVEGYEAVVLSGMKSSVPYVSFEVNLPEFLPEAIQCINTLENIGSNGTFNYVTDSLQGLAFPQWLSHAEFAKALESCREPCIEVFWHAPKQG